MKNGSGNRPSLWMATTEEQPLHPLKNDTEADVCIVGAGIAGLTVAYLLAEQGKSVVILDDGPIGGGETSRTTAHITAALDDRFVELERMFGSEQLPLMGSSHAAAIEEVDRIVTAEAIDCHFLRVSGYLFLAPGEEEKLLEDELDAAHRAGLRDVERLARAPGLPFDTGPCLHFPRQGQFHILRYLHGLAAAIERKGGKIYTGSHAMDIVGGGSARVETKDGKTVRAAAVVVATNTPVNDRVVMHTKQAPYRTYVVALALPKGSVPPVLLWDTESPYHYARLEIGETEDFLIVGGEDHKTGQAHDMMDRIARLEAWTRERFPQAGEMKFHWSGQVMEPVDGMGYIGRNPADDENVFISTGDSGNGMTHGTIAGMLIRDLILKRKNPWAELYDPARKPLRALKEFARENLNVAKEYADLLRPAKADPAAPRGRVEQRGLKKVALYRDERGEDHAFSALCPHLGCVVNWNEYEQSWDCPCHGSRFSAKGEVVNGPANGNMAEATG